MDILMIGHSGSGKTTFMAGLYSAMSEGVEGYKISAQRYLQEKDLDTVKENLSKGRYPDLTMIQQKYDFNLSYHGEHSIPFTWYDYRGGALMEKSDSSDDVRQLNVRISTSNALIIFIDGDVLVQPVETYRRQYQRLIWCVNSAINTHANESGFFPISFVITKGDKYSFDTLLDSTGFEYINCNLFNPVRNSKTIAGLFTITEITSYSSYNVFFPLLFSVAHAIPNYRDRIIKDHNRKMDNMGIFESIGEWLSGDAYDSTISKLNSLYANVERLEKLFEEHDGQSIVRF